MSKAPERNSIVKYKGVNIAYITQEKDNIRIKVIADVFSNKEDWYKAVEEINREINKLLLTKD